MSLPKHFDMSYCKLPLFSSYSPRRNTSSPVIFKRLTKTTFNGNRNKCSNCFNSSLSNLKFNAHSLPNDSIFLFKFTSFSSDTSGEYPKVRYLIIASLSISLTNGSFLTVDIAAIPHTIIFSFLIFT